jgi:arylsulfatase B
LPSRHDPPPALLCADFGWANTNYHRAEKTPEVVTPHMDALVADGIKLMRHYVHPEGTPTRVSFQTGRIPMRSGQGGLCSPGSPTCGAPYDMGTIAEKLVEGGMVAHFVGKWDVGMATPTHTPHGRGYNSTLNYFGHGNYQWGMVEWGANKAGRESGHTPSADGANIRDFYDTDRPAWSQANRSRDEGIYEEMIFRERLYSIVMHHEPSLPLFLTYCARIAHYPIQAPAEYQHRPHIAKIDVPHRLVYHAQVEFLDEQLGNLTMMFKDREMWEVRNETPFWRHLLLKMIIYQDRLGTDILA